MIGGLIVTHGRLAIELLNAAETITGEIDHIAAVSLGWHDDVGTAAAMVQKGLERVNTGDGVVILTDMFGGTPTNIASTFLNEGKVEIVTGVNLPMLIKVASMTPVTDLLTVAREMREHGRNAIWVASDLLRGEKG